MTGTYVMEGPLSKWTNLMKGWQYRWFVLDDNVGLLSYYTSREKRMRGERRGCVRLQGAVIGIDDEDDSTFTITVDQKTFHFQAKHADEKEQWINCLEAAIMKVSQPRLPYFAYNLGSPLSTEMSDFDRKLAEADAYLKILIDQIQDLQKRIISCPEEAIKDKFISLKSSAELTVEAIKQTIVFLQISKHNIMHMTTNHQPAARNHHDTLSTTSATLSSATFNNFTTADSSLNCTLSEGPVHRSAECLIDSYVAETLQSVSNHHEQNHLHPHNQVNYSSLSNSLPNLLTPSEDFHDVPGQELFAKITRDSNGVTTSDVPDESFSSSDEEDRFFDAEEETRDSITERGKVSPKVFSSQNNNTDNLYDEDEEEENTESMENHGSLLSHLLSQLHIGMDLTKVTLPTFILEKRSLLEMYSDFMAHPDLFVSITDRPNPKDRFIQTVRWYLSAFHAGKKSGVAKKPYNPILGECFKCYYDLPQASLPLPPTSLDDQGPDREGPIPWCSKNNLSFVAEQVSHHPPISAFYAECYNKRISINGYIWTKSKFLGLSVGVHMIGQAVISVLDYDEDYVVTFPNGYGRSILTVPWMELGGKVSITCAKTGYNAQIEFLTKPFYGGKKDQISAELFSPNDKRAFASIKGEWNGTMFMKTGNLNELFLDTKVIPIIKKQVKPMDLQEFNESRRLWRNVTYHLKMRSIEKATEFKCSLEQQQREEAKARNEAGVKFETKLFHEIGAHWVFDKPLVSRIDRSLIVASKSEATSSYRTCTHLS